MEEINIKELIKEDDLFDLETVKDCQMSPCGDYVVFSLFRNCRKTNKSYANLWVLPTNSEPAFQFTFGDYLDCKPKWSCCGKKILFLSNRDCDKQKQIYLIPFEGGGVRRLTDLKGEFGDFNWSNKGDKVVFSFCKKDEESILREEDKEKKKQGVICRKISKLFYKSDAKGFLSSEKEHIYILDVVSCGICEIRQITSGKYDEKEPIFSPCDKKILFCSNRSLDPDLEPYAIDAFLYDLDTMVVEKLDLPYGAKGNFSFSNCGKNLAYVGKLGKGKIWGNFSLWFVDLITNDVRNLTEKYDLHVDSATISDVISYEMGRICWSNCGGRIYFQVSRDGESLLMSIDLSGENLLRVIDKPGCFSFFSFDKEFSKIAYLYGDMKDPGQIWVYDFETKMDKKLTNYNEELIGNLKKFEVEEVWLEEKEDSPKIQGWIIKPAGFDKSRKYPSILEIHGGPFVQYGNIFMHEFFYLASKGYVVYFCNPRGSQGYGDKFAGDIEKDWGGCDYRDLMRFADIIESREYIDQENMMVTGGSYGGFMTLWIVGHTNRFKAAVSQRCVSNLISFYATSDHNWTFDCYFGEKAPWEDIDVYWNLSPLKYIGNCKTPTMIIHSEQDLRTSIEQSEQPYVALKKMGIDSELVLFPDESHGLSRGGRLDRRCERLRCIARWFEKYAD